LPEIVKINGFDTKSAYTSGDNKLHIEDTVKRFSPKSKGGYEVTEDTELDYLFATDILSEGQNLQDCGTLINFDLHWNPVRMIQRNGRINRLGSEYKDVYVHNMSPETNLELYLKLVARLEKKIAMISHTVGTDQEILGGDENPIEFTLDLYNEEKATATFNELEKDDVDFLSEDEYILDLRKFDKNANDEYKLFVKSIPIGKWGYFPKETISNLIAPSTMTLTKATGAGIESDIKFETYVFVETTDTVQPVETIEALKYLRTSPEDNERQTDKIGQDRALIKSRTLSVARDQAIQTKGYFSIKPKMAEVLVAMKTIAPNLNIRTSLDNIVTKQDYKMVIMNQINFFHLLQLDLYLCMCHQFLYQK
jgi:hypothetical protein